MFEIDRIEGIGRLALNTGLFMVSIGSLFELRKTELTLSRCTQTNLKNGMYFLLLGSSLNMYGGVRRLL